MKRALRYLWIASAVFVLLLCVSLTFLPPEIQVVDFMEISGPITNPLMGWAPWASLENIDQPHSLVYMDITWRELEPVEGYYDFTSFEEEMQMARWRQEGKRVVFRFVADYPSDVEHTDIPDWLFEKTAGDGVFYDNEYGKGYSPNYSNPLMIMHHELAINALAERYGSDGFFAFIELGSLGHWGEWHTHPDANPMPLEVIRELYVNQYKDAFSGTHLLLRRPFKIGRSLNLGLFNDMTGSLADTNVWLGWIENGGDFFSEAEALVPMQSAWETAPIGGEQVPGMRDEVTYGTNLGITLQLLTRSHTTFIGPEGGYDVPVDGSLQNGVDQVMSLIGYRIFIKQAEFPSLVKIGGKIKVKISFSNSGIAPFYYDWPARICLYAPNGQIVSSSEIDMDIRKILPGQEYQVEFSVPIEGLKNGRYTIGFAIIDPITEQPGVKLVNESSRSDLVQEVGSFEIRRIFND